VIALLALLLSVASVLWQVVIWRYTGSFVKVDNHGKFEALPSGPPFGYLVAVVARNVGRVPVTVTGVSFKLRSGVSLMTLFPEPWQGPATPHRLEAGDEVRWYAQEGKLLDGMTARPDTAEIVAEVFLATGKTVRAMRRLRANWLTIDRSQPDPN
jgi:hypothetical protein